MVRLFILSLCLLAVTFSVSTAPKLIVYISVDQMRADYFERYGHLMTGGLKRLYENGVAYTNADLNYASSSTGPGHAVLGTGCYPSKNGIVNNDWYDRALGKTVYCVEDSDAKSVEGTGGGISPKNLLVPAIGDWLKQSSKHSKVVSVSTKDRGAVLMGGKGADYVFWYGKSTGGMVTSDYYTKNLPAWAKEFNSSGWIEKNVPDAWTKLLPDSVYNAIGPDEFSAEPVRTDDTSFPHPFTSGKKHEQVMGTPYGDQLILDFAMTAVRGEQLGKRNVTDLLCISLSNCDYVGHDFGPDSHEILDLLLRIDRGLGGFFKTLDSSIGNNNYIVALSADHGVCSLPEFARQFHNLPAVRYQYARDIKPAFDSLSLSLSSRLKTNESILLSNRSINYAAAERAGWDSVKLEQEIKKGLTSIEAYADVIFRREMESTVTSDQRFIQKYRNSYLRSRCDDYQLRIREHCLISSRTTGTTHGSPYEYDTNVPLLFWYNGITPQKISRRVHSADAAPTLAALARFAFPKNLDGVPLPELTR